VHPHVYWYLANKAADAEKYPSGELGQLRADPPGAMRDEIALALHPYVLLKFLPFSETGKSGAPCRRISSGLCPLNRDPS